MSSTLGVLDVLSRLRDESERASTALIAQEGANRGMIERCRQAEEESGRIGPLCEQLRKRRAQLEEDLRCSKSRKQDAQGRLRRLQKENARRENTAAQKREAARTTADRAIESSKKFRSDTSARLRQIGELRARLREKTGELERIQEQTKELDDEVGAKTASRNKVKAEVQSRREALAAAASTAHNIGQENRTMLSRARHVEKEIDEVRQTQEEIQEIALGLRNKNAMLRNELRNLKRASALQDEEVRTQQASTPACNEASPPHLRPHHIGARGGHASRGARDLDLRPSKGYGSAGNRSRYSDLSSDKEPGVAGAGHYYHHASVPLQQKGATTRVPQPDNPLCGQPSDHRTGSSSSSSRSSSKNGIKTPFRTAAEVMAIMPELRLSSPHPASRTTSATASPFRYQQTNRERATSWPGDRRNDTRSEDHGGFEYHA